MGVRSHRDLEAWQLCDQVRRKFHDITDRDHVRHDRDFCSESRRASNSACRNIAEGFYRYGHREFANFVNIAKGSLGELFDSTDEALIKKYIDDEEHKELNELLERAKDTTGGLHKHLRSTPTPKPKERRRRAAEASSA
jgi:four helix bundle protein